MNVRTATLLSVAGVLAAGTAAVAVNTQVLTGSAGPAELAAPLTLPVATQVYTVPSADDGRVRTAMGSEVVLVAEDGAAEASPVSGASTFDSAQTVVTDSPMVANTSMIFRIGEAGVATVDTAGGTLAIVDVSPSAGWRVSKADGSGTVRLEFELTSASMKVNFGAFLSGGEVITSISSESIGSTSDGAYHDDHDDDEHDDDHDDDHDRGDDDD